MKIKAGISVQLNNVNCYKSSKSTTVIKQLSGEYYFWNDTPLNNRIRVTNDVTKVSKKDQAVGWILLADLEFAADNKDAKIASTSSKSEETSREELHKDEECITEIVDLNNSLLTICWRYFGSYDKLPEIMQENNLTVFSPKCGTEVKVWVKKN